MTETTSSEPPISETEKESIKIASMLTMFNVVAKILAIRLFLFLSVIGSFTLALIADEKQSVQSILVVLLFAIVTTLPLTLIELKGKSGG